VVQESFSLRSLPKPVSVPKTNYIRGPGVAAILSSCLISFWFAASAAAQCSRWERFEPTSFVGHDGFTAAAYGSEGYLISDSQDMYASTDGLNWDQTACSMSWTECMINHGISAVVWNGTEFIAIGNSATDKVYRIADNRIEIAGECPGRYRDIGFNGDRYVAVGDHTIATSFDAETWTHQYTPMVICGCLEYRAKLASVTWDGSQWIAVGDTCGFGILITSVDGYLWSPPSNPGLGLRSAATNAGVTIAVGDVSIRSTDGTTWSAIADLPSGMNTVVWSGEVWLAAGAGGIIFASPDGLSWAPAGTTNGMVEELAVGDGTAIAVGLQTLTRFDSERGWTDLFRRIPEAPAVVWNGERFLAAGYDLYTSSDGTHWQWLDRFTRYSFKDLSWSSGTHVAVGYEQVGTGWQLPSIQTSTDGLEWSVAELPPELVNSQQSLAAIARGEEYYVVVGNQHAVRSKDAIEWEAFPLVQEAFDIVWGGDRFVALTAVGSITSLDGAEWTGPHTVWTSVPPAPTGIYPRLATDGASYVAIGFGGKLYRSADAVTWSACAIDADSQVADVIWSHETGWLAVTLDAQILTSDDGTVWLIEDVPWDPSPPGTMWLDYYIPNRFRLAAGGGRTVALAEDMLLVRDCIPPSPRRSGGRLSQLP